MPPEGEAVIDTLNEPYVFPGEPYESIHLQDFLVVTPWRERWEQMPPVVDNAFRDRVVRKFINFHNLENPEVPSDDKDGAKEAHHSFTDYLFSDDILPCITQIHEWAQKTGNEKALRKSSATMVFLNDALDLLSEYSRSLEPDTDTVEEINGKTNESAALANLLSENVDAHQTSFQFLTLMKIARIQARQCLWEFKDEPVDTFVEPVNGKTFHERSMHALSQFTEAKQGIKVPDYFINRLMDPSVRALVISLDYNSTFNTHESFTATELLKKVNQKLKRLSRDFKKYFPEKDIFIIINTGRSSIYAWAVIEASLEPIKALRSIAIVEAGGAELKEGMTKGIAEANVDNPAQWKQELEEIKTHLASIITTKVRFEDKLSMVSMEVAPRNGDGSTWMHKTTKAEPVTDTWIQEQLTKYIENTLKNTSEEYTRLLKEQITVPETGDTIREILTNLPQVGPDGEPGTKDDISSELLQRIKEIISEHTSEIKERIDLLSNKIQVLQHMRKNLVVRFNRTAGFVDIMLKHQNKLSGMMHALKKRGYTPDEIVALHVGDAMVDVMPNENDEFDIPIPGNKGANDVLEIGVANSSNEFRKHVKSRGDRGHMTARPSASGVIDILAGLNKAFVAAKKRMHNGDT